MRESRSRLTAELRSARKPTEEQLQRFEQFLSRTYRRRVPLSWEEAPSLRSGFRLQVGSDIYDWTFDGRVRQLIWAQLNRAVFKEQETSYCSEIG